MKSFITLLLAIAAIATTFAQDQDLYFAHYPCLTPDGKTVVFSYEGDLWQAATTTNAQAVRLTAMDGNETHPKISPDGKWLTFTSSQYGNQDVYVMPMGGGIITQLTYHQGYDQVESWSWDSQTIYFRSNRYNRMSAYSIQASGGTPKRLYDHYFNNIHNVVEHPTTGEIFFNESWESSNFTHRKRYKGPYNPEIKSYNAKTGEYKVYTDYEGKDMWATIDKNGNVYFVSDEKQGEYNLFQLDGNNKKRLTNFKSSVIRPSVSADGSAIVFEKDYQLHIYDTKSKKTRQLNISIFKNKTLAKAQNFNVKGNISSFDVSDDNKKLVFVSRGELFVSDIKGKFVKQIPTAADGRVTEVYFLKDNKTIIFNQTVGGYLNWFTVHAGGNEAAKQHTSDKQNNRNIAFNSDKSKAVYLSGRNEVRLMDLENFDSQTLVEDELWGLYSDIPSFSPDDEYVTFTAYRNFEKDIIIHHINDKKTYNLTNTSVTETSPVWSPDGKYIYFLSNRTKPSYPYGLQDARLYRMAMQNLNPPFRSDKFDDLFAEKEPEKKEDNNDDDEKEEGEEDKETDNKDKDKIVIDFDRMMERLEQIGPQFGAQSSPVVLQKGDKTTVLFGSNHDEGRFNIFKIELEPFEQPKTEKINGASTRGVALESAKDNHYILVSGTINKLNLSQNKLSKIDISHSFSRNLEAEFEQMFYETWANLEVNFYNETFHGVDWAAMRDKYAAFLPKVNSRANLRTITNDMLGELNTSHFGFYSNGKEENIYYGTTTLATGILFENDNPYTVAKIVSRTAADKSDITIGIGDELVKVNGEAVDKSQNREKYFTSPAIKNEISLTFNGSQGEYTVKIHPSFYGQVGVHLYDEWIDENQAKVDKNGNNRIAYVHMKNMGGGQLQHFLQEMVSEGTDREAVILDLRWNTGGNVHDDVLQFLSRKKYLNWKYREGALAPQSNFDFTDKPIVLLINEQSLSDAEMTSQGFKQLGLGTIIGNATYRWIIFTSGQGLVDGSFYRLPSWGCYTLDGKNLEQTGVEPDIKIIETFKDRLTGNDPQLDKAIEVILGELK